MRRFRTLMLIGGFCASVVGPGATISYGASVPVATGTIQFVYPLSNNVSPEGVQYLANKCTGNVTDAKFQAFVDLRALQGKTLRLSTAGVDLGGASVITVLFKVACEAPTMVLPSPGTFARDGKPATFVATTPYVVLVASNTGNIGSHFSLVRL